MSNVHALPSFDDSRDSDDSDPPQSTRERRRTARAVTKHARQATARVKRQIRAIETQRRALELHTLYADKLTLMRLAFDAAGEERSYLDRHARTVVDRIKGEHGTHYVRDAIRVIEDKIAILTRKTKPETSYKY